MTALFAIFLPLAIAYGGTWRWLVESWSHETSYYAHGPLVPLVVVVVIWLRRGTWRAVPPLRDAQAWWLLGPALLLHLAGAALTIDSLSGASLVLAVPAAAWLAHGRARLRGMWPALWFVAFCVPMPIFLSGRLVFELKEFAVSGALALARALGSGVERSGADLLLPGQQERLFVADPCGGLNSLLSLVTLAYCVAFFVGPAQTGRRLVLLVAAVPIALLVNLLRVTGLCLLADRYSVPWASTTGHAWLNVAEWVLALALLLGVDRLASRICARTA